MTTTAQLLTDYIEKDEAAAELGVCERTLDRWHQLREGPPRVTIGRRILYRRSSVAAWLASREEPAPATATNSRHSRPRKCADTPAV
jgi:predicted DNA-binding transcriptional regulator AlpA